MQTITFFALLLNLFFGMVGLPMALYCLLGAMLWKDLKTFVHMLFAVAGWVAVLFLYIWAVPSGEMSASQFTGFAGLMQIIFCIASYALFRYSRIVNKQQTKILGKD